MTISIPKAVAGSAALAFLLLSSFTTIKTSYAQQQNSDSGALTRRVSLPKVSIYMLCENENIENIDFEGEMESYYDDLLATKNNNNEQDDTNAVKDIELTVVTEFDNCKLEPNMTQTRIYTSDGSVRLLVDVDGSDITTDNDGADTDTTTDEDDVDDDGNSDTTQLVLQNEIQQLVSKYSLRKHFRGICVNELDIFEVEIKKASNADDKEEDDEESSSFTTSLASFAGVEERYISTICNINQDQAQHFGITGVSIILIVVFAMVVCLTCCVCCVCRGSRRRKY